MRRWHETTALIAADLIGSFVAFLAALFIRAGRPEPLRFPLSAPEWAIPLLFVAALWIALFAFVGLYGDWRFKSRLEEGVLLAKAVSFGGLVLFILTFDPNSPMPGSRIVILSYWASLIAACGAGRFIVRGSQRHLLRLGKGRRKAAIVGTGSRAHHLLESLARYPVQGHEIVGFVALPDASPPEPGGPVAVLGEADDLPKILTEHGIEEVMFADPQLSRDDVLDVVAQCNGVTTEFFAVPDLYDVVIGRSGIGQLFGTPLMSLFPEYMPVWEWRVKRMIDVALSSVVLVVGFPIWVLLAVAIRLDSSGPAVFSQERVGQDGQIFNVYKFRSMVEDAEKNTGPVWAGDDDPRITRLGRFIRLYRLDEIPQMWNIFKGEMSLVGPRPERPFFVDKFALDIPLYRRRTRVKPGLTGWAQTKLAYDATLDDVREKLTCDLYYIENMSLKFDVIIFLRTVGVVLTGKGAR